MTLPATGWTNTPKLGLTVPVEDNNTDIGDWGAIAYQLGLDIENSFFLTLDSHAASDLPATYPLGINMMRITSAGASSGGWPAGGTVMTIRRDDGGATYQLMFVAGANSAVSWRYNTTSGWSGWFTFAGSGNPAATASGMYTFTSANTPRSVTIALPAGRFSTIPMINATPHDTGVVAAISGKSTTSFTLNIAANGGASSFPTANYNIDWTATQNY